jgi:predicted nucleic acid-binding protein
LEVRSKKFLEAIESADNICIDTPVLIYHLEDIDPYNKLTKIFIKEVASNRITCTISALTITELLTKPFSRNNIEKVKLFDEFIKSLPNTIIREIDYEVARKAASIRAIYKLRIPDSLILSTAFQTGSQLFITNDIALKKIRTDFLKITVLDDYL